MKIAQLKIRRLIFLVFTALAVSACQTKEEITSEDCSMLFDNSFGSASDLSSCKFLPLKINASTQCQISGTNKVDNLLNFYSQNQDGKIFFMAPLDILQDLSGDISFMDQIKYFSLIRKVSDHIDSDLFKSLKDFRYKGMNCTVEGNKFTGWISDKEVIIIYEANKKADNKAVVIPEITEIKSTTHTKKQMKKIIKK